MNETPMSARESSRPAPWKQWLLTGLGVGIGFAFTLAAIAGVYLWHASRPQAQKPWNKSAIKASFLQIDTETDGVSFHYVVENTTDSDVRLTEADKPDVAAVISEADALVGFNGQNVKLMLPLYIPAKHKSRVTVELLGYKLDAVYPGFNATDAERSKYHKAVEQEVSSRFPKLGGFEVFIDNGRFEIDMPKGW
jgi:hypothetical protein